MSDQALDRVRDLLRQMGYANVAEDVLLDIWNASQAQLLQSCGLLAPEGTAAAAPQHPHDTSQDTESVYSSDSNAFTDGQKERLFQQYAAEPPAAAQAKPAAHHCHCNKCTPSSKTDHTSASSASPARTAARGKGRQSAAGSPMSDGSDLASVTTGSAGLGDSRALNKSVIYAMDPYGTHRQQQRPARSDPVAKYHQMQRVWQADKFLTQADRRRLMWATRVSLAQQSTQ